MRTWARRVGIGLGAVAAVFLLLGWLLLGTGAGARFALDRLVPGVEVEAVSGRLWGGLRLEGVRYGSEGLEVTAEAVRLEWRPGRLLRRTLHVTSLEVRGLEARLRETEPDTAGPGGVPRPSVPGSVILERLRIDGARVLTAAGDTVAVDTVDGAVAIRGDRFRIDTLRVIRLTAGDQQLSARARGLVVTGAEAPRDTADLTVEWEGTLANGRRVAGSGGVTGGRGRYDIHHHVTAPVAAALTGRVTDVWDADALQWRLSARVPRFAIAALVPEAAGGVEAELHASGDVSSAQATVQAGVRHPISGPVTVEGRFRRLEDGTLWADTLLLVRTEGPGQVAGTGRLALGDDGPSGELALRWRDLGWPLDSAAVSSPAGRAELTGRPADWRVDVQLALARPDGSLGDWRVTGHGSLDEALAATLEWEGRLPDRPRLHGTGRLRYGGGRLVVPELAARVGDGPGRVALEADLDVTGPPRGTATVQWSDLEWERSGSESLSSPSGRVDVRGAMDGFTLTASTGVRGGSLPTTRVELELQGSADTTRIDAHVQGSGVAEGHPAVRFAARTTYRIPERRLRVDTLDIDLPATGGRLAGRGEAGLVERPWVRGRLRWRDLGWPLVDPVYWSEAGSVTAETRSGDVRLTASAHVGGTRIPEGQWALTGHGDLRGPFAVDTLRGRVLDGRIDGRGTVRMDSGPAWDVRITGDSLNPGLHRAEWPGSVAFALATRGRLAESGPVFEARLDTLRGRLRGRELDGAGAVTSSGGHVRLDSLWLRSGTATIQADGAVGDTLDARWQVNAEALADLAPGLAGRLVAHGWVRGPRQAPAVRMEAEGQSLTVAGWTVDNLVARGDVDVGGEPSSLDVALRGIRGPSLAMDSVTLGGRGTPSSHEATLRVFAPGDTAETGWTGTFVSGVWHGRLERLALRSERAGDWILAEPTAVTIGPDSGRIEELCWTGPGHLCLETHWNPAGGEWHGTGDDLPMAFLAPVLPQSVSLEGTFSLESRGVVGGGALPTGIVRVTGSPGSLDYQREVGRAVTQAHKGFTLEATSDSAGATAAVRFDLGALGSVDASAQLSGSGPVAERSVSATLTAQLEDDGTLSRFVPALAGSQGHAEATIDVDGTVRSPRVHGQLSISGVEATVVPAGIRLREGRISGRSEGSRWHFDGGIRSDTGSLALSGAVRPPTADSAWYAELAVQGQRFRAYQTPELLLLASPDLRLRASPDSIQLTGGVTVPRARIAVRQLENTVHESPDVVLLAETDASAEPGSTLAPAAYADVRLLLGDSVMLDALGVTGRLEGQLSIRYAPGRSPTGSGELGILDGRYRIYRQTFQIDRGRLLYAAAPLTNPGLDLRITRRRDDVLAGMEITGRADDPRVQLFSEPTLSDDEILAYLIAGRPLRRLSQSEGGQVQDVAERVGVAGGNLVLARLSALFGLERARLERTSTGTGESSRRSTSLVLGGQILPRVHLDYAIGLTGAANILRLRYMITDHWILQTENGEETGADLLYSIER